MASNILRSLIRPKDMLLCLADGSKTEQRVSESGDKMGSRKRLKGAIQIGKQWHQRST